jgi:uncharacterized membrane protein HdeD (DUF308 family)
VTTVTFVIVIGLYAVGMGLFHVPGGLGAAAEALKRWGEASSRVVGR